MRRALVITTCALGLALTPAALFAQPPPAQPPPAQPPPAQQTPAQQPPAQETPQLAFAAPAGMIFNQIKPDQTAAFEEVMGKLKEALNKSTDPVRKQQSTGWKVYKATEAMGANTLYVFLMDPAVPGADYNVFKVLQEGLGDATAREIFEKFRNAYAGPQNKINLTPVAAFGGAPMR